MSDQQSDRQFAYGDNSYDGCPCPAQAAGYSPADHDDLIGVAEEYDHFLEASPSDKGTVDEQQAKAAWDHAIDYHEQTRDNAMPSMVDHYEKIVHKAKLVRDELGW